MAIFASLIARLGMDTAQWTAGNVKAREEVEKTGKTSRGIFKELDSLFGKKAYKSSEFGQLMKLVAGGGAIAGLSMAAGSIKHMTSSILEMQQAFRKGEATAYDLADGIANAIPVFGSLYGAARDVREMITGETAAEERLLAVYQRQKKAADEKTAAILKAKKAVRDYGFDTQEQTEKAFQAIDLANTNDEVKRQVLQIQQAYQENVTKAKKDLAAFLSTNPAKGLAEQYTKDNLALRAVLLEQKQAEVAKVRRDADKKHMEETERMMKDRRREELAAIAETEREQSGALNRLKSKLENDIKEGEKQVAYRGVNTPSVRGGFGAINTPEVQTRLLAVNTQQLDQLKRVNDALRRLGEKTDDEILMTIPGI